MGTNGSWLCSWVSQIFLSNAACTHISNFTKSIVLRSWDLCGVTEEVLMSNYHAIVIFDSLFLQLSKQGVFECVSHCLPVLRSMCTILQIHDYTCS